ncbi:MAG: hypothetical protein ACPHCI_09050, partial [Solirubrobacterales bacterium]
VLLGQIFAVGAFANKMRAVDAPIVSAMEKSSGVVLAIAIPDRCEKGKLYVRYMEDADSISVKARYARRSVLPPSDFGCEAKLRLNGLVVKVVLNHKSDDVIDSGRNNLKPKFIFDESQAVSRQVVYVTEFSPEPRRALGPGLELQVERVSSLD